MFGRRESTAGPQRARPPAGSCASSSPSTSASPWRGSACSGSSWTATRPGRRRRPLLDLGLTERGVLGCCSAELLRTLRQQGAVTMPEEVDPADEMFDPRRGPIYVRGDGAGGQAEGAELAAHHGGSTGASTTCAGCWPCWVPATPTPARCCRVLAVPHGAHATAGCAQPHRPGLGQVHQVDHSWLRLPAGAARGQMYQCDCAGGCPPCRCGACARRSAATGRSRVSCRARR